jgi:HD-GYP domain-containing protein (c-di-GMP phosphodiesterase class II)
MENIKLTALTNKISFTGDLYIDNLFLLAPKSTPVSQELINALQLWQFEEFQLDGNVSLGGDIGVSANGNKDQNDSEDNQPKENLGSSVKKVLEDSRAINIANDESLRLNMVKNVYLEYANYIESVYTHYSTHKEINQEELSETVQELCIFVKDNKRFLLRLLPDTSLINKNFLVIHSLRCTVLAIATALQLHMPLSKMIELGVCCILHEIGMLQLPPQIYMGSKQLTPGEKAMISKHPVYGYSIVKNLNFPTTIQLGILEHHEKENGTGYPRRLQGDKLSYAAKIISIVCSYEAITSKRNYKSERSSLDGMVELLLNKNNAYSPDIVRALLHTVSLYPIGTYVYLKNRKIAIVTDTVSDNPKCPIVQLVTEKKADGSPVILETENPENAILRVLTKQEQSDVLKIVEEKRKLIEEAQKIAMELNTPTNPQNESPKSEENVSEKKELVKATFNENETEEVDLSFFN